MRAKDKDFGDSAIETSAAEKAARSARFLKFAERGHLMRWFGERTNNELKALQEAFKKSEQKRKLQQKRERQYEADRNAAAEGGAA
jgi:hypothetical protein